MGIISKAIAQVRSLKYYVVADPRDNSITVSRRLFSHMRSHAKGDAAQVFVFKEQGSDSFGFILDPMFEEPTQLCDIQYNEKYRCIGFESLCPSVVRICYEYGLPDSTQARLSVSICRTGQGGLYYRIDRPNIKRKQT